MPTMHHAPGTLPAHLAALREAAITNPVLAYIAVVALTALAARWLARHI